ncbi:DNA polymerase IV [Siculibacillus lacustris]|uniref:DNA polymerase IV n=1 Tax=Siculibacillus lacustris TaxID=1549641 RepID=A0A4Q9VHH5_9HYPH|nr:DNA polymerase IV [Siculibacillus lacustris]TBW34309.1 DNA polymerase IV [Siculibacillus lacustris]
MSGPVVPPSPPVLRPKAFCRDCFTPVKPTATRCPKCGGPRIVAHDELDRLSIAHVDCDAFYASVEKRDDPSLADKPVIIGGGRRGVVSTACYVARISGVKSAMPMWKALEACPDAVVIRPNMEKYTRVGHEIRTLMRELTPLVEPLSIDEAFLDLGGTELLHHASPALTLARFAARVEREIGVTLSVGLSHNKFLAKIASDLDKPRGYSVIGAAETLAFLAPRPVTTIWGVGKATAEALHAEGIRTVGDLRGADESRLFRRFGVLGRRLKELAVGQDRRHVEPDREIKSVSNELTLDTDVADYATLEAILFRLATKVSRRLKAAGIGGSTVQLKLKTPDFKSHGRNRRLADPTALADRIFRTGQDLLKREVDGRRFRLIGIGVADLVPIDRCDPPDLIDEGAGKRARAEAAIDALRQRFGTDVVEPGRVFASRPRAEPRARAAPETDIGDEGESEA